jgi:hypothetical protein
MQTQMMNFESRRDNLYIGDSDVMEGTNSSTSEIARVAVRLPSFWAERPASWFTLEEMGDRKPSKFLRHLRSLAPDIPDNYLSNLWSSSLPTDIQTIRAGTPEVELEAAALCAGPSHRPRLRPPVRDLTIRSSCKVSTIFLVS